METLADFLFEKKEEIPDGIYIELMNKIMVERNKPSSDIRTYNIQYTVPTIFFDSGVYNGKYVLHLKEETKNIKIEKSLYRLIKQALPYRYFLNSNTVINGDDFFTDLSNGYIKENKKSKKLHNILPVRCILINNIKKI